MACLSPSPSGRRLSELLEEKQEPFFLDLHLLEKGCSGRLLDSYDTALCWPAGGGGGGNDAASVLKRLTSKKKKAAAAASTRGRKQPAAAGSGVLRLLLSKILHGKAAAGKRKPAALQCSESFKRVSAAAVAPSPKHLEAVKLRADAAEVAAAGDHEGTECSDSSDDYDDEKQLSPVSVLEHPFESSPVHAQSKCSNVQGSPKNAMAIVRELLLEAAYSPALLTQLLAKSEDLIGKEAGDLGLDVDHDGEDYYHRTSPKNFHHDADDEDDETAAAGTTTPITTTTTAAAYWEKHRAELARVSELVASEVPRSRLDAADAQPQRRDVGADVEAAVLEALLLELVVDLGSC